MKVEYFSSVINKEKLNIKKQTIQFVFYVQEERYVTITWM
jgi:hypothetical protein